MFIYWLLFTYFALAALLTSPERHEQRQSLFFWLGMFLIWVASGLRYEVGGDWKNYLHQFDILSYFDFDRALNAGDPGYQFLAWVIERAGGRIWQLNLLCSAIFVWGLNRFARSQPDPILTVLVAIPYLIVVVAMGYTRQATAIGVLMAGLAALLSGASVLRFSAYVAVATLFHKTAVVMLPFAVFATQRNRFVNLMVGAVATVLLYEFFLADSWDRLVENYLVAHYASQGAAIRLSMSLLPAVIFFVLRNRLDLNEREDRLWWIFSLTSAAMLVLLLTLPSSTAVDRLALYLIPLQLAIIPRLAPMIVPHQLGGLTVVGYAGLVLFIWLNFAVHAQYWLPYRFYPM